jgi:dienelactone hydrolase
MNPMLILLFFLTIFGACAAERFPEQAKDSESIRDEQYRQMDRYFDQWIAKAANRRAEYWKRLDFSSVEAYERSVRPYREDWSNYLAVPAPGSGAPGVRQVKVHEFDAYTAYRVWIDALPGVQAYGILLIPKKAGRKPALICLHGHQGTPEIIAGFLPDAQSQIDTYRMFARTAVERGYVVWCPLILSFYSEEHEPQEGPEAQGRDILQKKATITGHTLMGLEIAKIRRGIDFLESLPDVDPRRIGIYGLSKGGHYTLYTAALEPRLKAVVVSGWFNDRTKKLLAPRNMPGMFFITFIHRDEYFLPDLLDRFGDAELAWMVASRALMIENGTRDTAVLVQDAREEFRRVEQVYRRIGMQDRARFASFTGPHRIDGAESWPFLDKWLDNTQRGR